MRRTTLAALLAATFVLPAGTALAGHTNELLITMLDGREVVDPANPGRRLAGDPDGMGIGYVFGIDGDPTTLCYVLTVEKIQLVPVGEGMAAHIHEGVRDTAGPVVASLAGPEDGNAADCLTEGEMGKFPTGEAGIVQEILNNPSEYYINVHNPEFPDGVIRGQLRSQGSHDDTDSDMDVDMGDSDGAPTVPMNLTGQVYSRTALELMWERSTDDVQVANYEIYQNGALVSTKSGNSYFTEGLVSGTSYEYSLIAVDNEGNRSAASQSVTLTTR